MKLSILLRTRNSAGELMKFASRAHLGDELVVVDHGSMDGSREVAQKLGAKIVDYPFPGFSYGAALNLGVRSCTADWVLVASPHFEPLEPNFWDCLLGDLASLPEDFGACQAPTFLTRQGASAHGGVTWFDSRDLATVPWRLYGNTCCAYRRSLLEKFPFDEDLPTAEDAEWCHRIVQAGYRFCIDHRIPVIYRNRAPLRRYWQRGRTDYPAVSQIFQVEMRPRVKENLLIIGKEGAQFLLGRLPFWLWVRLFVKRLAELSLAFG